MEHQAILLKAMEFATQAHAGEWRDGPGPLPYLTHPVDVVNNLRYIGGVTGVDILAAGFLHDTVEAGASTPEEIAQEFGPRVAALVRGMTRTEPSVDEASGLDPEELWQLRHELMMRDISERMDDNARTIKLADRLSNLRSAQLTRSGVKLERYVRQSAEILQRIPRRTNPALWDAVADLLPQPNPGAESKTC